MNNLINWSELTRILNGSENPIRPDKIPRKYAYKVRVLFVMLEAWVKLIKED